MVEDRTTPHRSRRRDFWIRLGLIALFVLALLALLRYGLGPVLSLLQGIESLVDGYFLVALVAYSLSFIVLATLGLPVGTLYCLAGGYLFGVTGGAALALFGSMVSAVLTFWLAQRHFSDGLRRWLERGRAARLKQLLTRDATWYLVMLRIVPIAPFFAVNAAAGLLGIGLARFTLATAAGLLPIVVIYAGLGSGLGSIIDAGEIGPAVLLRPGVLLPLCGLAILIALGWWWRRQVLRRRSV
ncbi:MAG: VTT domain-containing protein [Wenzhouxiangellaceae bacterium]|nr:VTT domain-containing protein [Wenzhouxiangellaceae bacterium]